MPHPMSWPGLEFDRSMLSLVGETLIAVPPSSRNAFYAVRTLGRQTAFDLLAAGRPVASVRTDGRRVAMACREGQWTVARDGRAAWGLALADAATGASAGRYAGHRLRSGGSITLADGSWGLVTRRVGRGWQVRSEGGETFVVIDVRHTEVDEVKLLGVPPGILALHLFVLAACAVVLLEGVARAAAGSIGGGGGS
jgi:hypothetical protein